MYESLDSRHVKKLAQIKLRNNQYLPHKERLMMSHKKLNKSKSQFLNLSNQVETNRKNINSVNKALKKRKPVDYYEEGKYLYDRQIENIQKLYLDNLKNKNDKLEEQLKDMKKKMIKIPLYKLNGKRKKKSNKEINGRIINKEQKKGIKKESKKEVINKNNLLIQY